MPHENSKGVTSRDVPRAPIIAAALLLLTGGAHAAVPWFGGETPSLAPMLEKVMPAVVNVATEGKVRVGRNPLLDDPLFRHFFDVPDEPRERKTQSLGSGVIVDAGRGLIITNAHVVANAEHITVKLRNSRKLDAKRVGVDAETDVAVIQVPAEGLTALGFGDSDGLKVGDFVVAIGNPFGLDQTVTSGIVSALGRSGLGIEGYEEFIQTDASINPGNSGGALVDLQGRLVGINTAIFSQSGGSIGIGFAIPINVARQVMEQLAQHGEVKRGQLGVQLQDLDPDLAEAFDLNEQEGAVVVNVVEGSPAAKAGLKAGDVVVAVNGRPVRNASDLRSRVGLLRIGDKVTLEVLRKGLLGKNDRVQISAAVAPKIDQATSGSALQNPRLEGARFGDIPERSPAHGEVEGVMVYEVKRGSRAWRNGLREGDIVLSVNQVPVSNLKEFLGQVNRLESAVLLHVLRGNSAAFIVAR
ncbi:MAG: DegQ family serine endoprotease [Pseudomonadota bacterium]|nr:DegQ family serine endoprotease [Gammaproteobacteria bacterium]MDQ3581624.1 DegQ family serine endoprotease [Pseudomonadota bacterium]